MPSGRRRSERNNAARAAANAARRRHDAARRWRPGCCCSLPAQHQRARGPHPLDGRRRRRRGLDWSRSRRRCACRREWQEQRITAGSRDRRGPQPSSCRGQGARWRRRAVGSEGRRRVVRMRHAASDAGPDSRRMRRCHGDEAAGRRRLWRWGKRQRRVCRAREGYRPGRGCARGALIIHVGPGSVCAGGRAPRRVRGRRGAAPVNPLTMRIASRVSAAAAGEQLRKQGFTPTSRTSGDGGNAGGPPSLPSHVFAGVGGVAGSAAAVRWNSDWLRGRPPSEWGCLLYTSDAADE